MEGRKTRKEIIDKVQKLLNMADPVSNCFEGEIEVAMKMAHKLLRIHGLQMADVSEAKKLKGAKEGTTILEGEAATFKCSYIPKWMNLILQTVNIITDTQTIFRKFVDPKTNYGTYHILLIGSEVDTAVATELFDYLRKTVSKRASAHKKAVEGNGTNWRSFAEGCGERLYSRAEKLVTEMDSVFTADDMKLHNFQYDDDEEIPEEEELDDFDEFSEESKKKFALVLVSKQNEIDKYIQGMNVKEENRRYTNKKNTTSFVDGQREANKISLKINNLVGD